MKRLFTIMLILLIIFMGMYSYRMVLNKRKNITAIEVDKIQEYISKIYMWKEVTGEALPKFKDINDAPELWLWEVVNKNLEEYELKYETIVNKSKELFGENFLKTFPKEGSEFIIYNQDEDKYYTSGMGLDTDEDSFFINKIERTKDGYKVEILEYLVDYTNVTDSENTEQESEYDIYVKNLNGDNIDTLKSTDGETKVIETVKNNIDKFTNKTINLENNKNICVKSVE